MSVKDMLLLQKSKDMVDSTDEKRLLAELGAGSFQAFEKLYHRYGETRSHTDGFQRNNAKCLDEKGISRFVPHSSI